MFNIGGLMLATISVFHYYYFFNYLVVIFFSCFCCVLFVCSFVVFVNTNAERKLVPENDRM